MQQVVFGLLIIGFLVFEPHGLLEIWRASGASSTSGPSGPDPRARPAA
jgi:hypothetical protein